MMEVVLFITVLNCYIEFWGLAIFHIGRYIKLYRILPLLRAGVLHTLKWTIEMDLAWTIGISAKETSCFLVIFAFPSLQSGPQFLLGSQVVNIQQLLKS